MTVPQWISDFTEPNVCAGENIVIDDGGNPRIAGYAIPRLVVDVRAGAQDGTGKMYSTTALPGKLLIDQKVSWRNDAPLPREVLIRITRGSKRWIVSSPNAIQFRDKWTHAIDAEPSIPYTTTNFNSQVGSAIDFGTNSVAEPNPGKQWTWVDANSSDEIVGPVPPESRISLHYRCYVWTPPPWSDNANKNQPLNQAFANWTRIQLIALPTQGTVVSG